MLGGNSSPAIGLVLKLASMIESAIACARRLNVELPRPPASSSRSSIRR
jgi:hypothetical protein